MLKRKTYNSILIKPDPLKLKANFVSSNGMHCLSYNVHMGLKTEVLNDVYSDHPQTEDSRGNQFVFVIKECIRVELLSKKQEHC